MTDAVYATMLALKNVRKNFEVYNVGNEDWITVEEVAKAVIETLGIRDAKIIYKPMLHGIGWPGDVKYIALNIAKLAKIGFKPSMGSLDAVKLTVKVLMNEIYGEN